MRRFGNNLASLLGWRSAGRDVREEMRLHVELHARDLEAGWLAPDAARARAVREVGSLDAVEMAVAKLGASTDRASAIRQRFDELLQDLKYAARSFRRSPGFTTLAVLTIAFGLGANVAIFGVVNVAFLTPLPFDPDNTLARVREFRTLADGRRLNGDGSRRTADAVAAMQDVFSDSVAISGSGRALACEDGAVRIAGSRAGPRFTAVVGIAPVVGRTFTVDEEQGGEGSVVLISDRLWHSASSRPIRPCWGARYVSTASRSPSSVFCRAGFTSRTTPTCGFPPASVRASARSSSWPGWRPACPSCRRGLRSNRWRMISTRAIPMCCAASASRRCRRASTSWETTAESRWRSWAPSRSCCSSRARTSRCCCRRSSRPGSAKWPSVRRSAADAAVRSGSS